MKRIPGFCFVTVAFISLFFLNSCQSSKSSTASKMLKFGFEKGKGFDYEMIMSMDQEVMGQKMKMDMTSYFSMNVLNEEGPNKIISTIYDRFKMNMDMGVINISIDTDEPVADTADTKEKKVFETVNKMIGAIKGRKFLMKVNPEGKILELSGFKGMAEAMADSMGIEGSEKDQMLAQFDQSFNDQSVKEQFERFWYIFPNKKVKVGDSWERKSTATGMAAGNYNSTYTVKEIEGEMVTLEENSIITGGKEGMNLEGKVKGELVIDSKTGLIVNADQDITIKTTKEGLSIDVIGKSKLKGKANN